MASTTEPSSLQPEEKGKEETEKLEAILSKTEPELYESLKNQPEGFQKIVRIARIVSESHEGPLPPPRVLQGYEQVLPGAAERLFVMAEKEQSHAHQLNEKMVDGMTAQSRTGQSMGFFIAIFGLLVGFICMMAGGYWINSTLIITGGGVIGVDLIALVALFLKTAGHQNPASVKQLDEDPPK